MTEQDIFEPYEKLITITIFGEEREVPENNSILRCLQYLNVEAVSQSELCWNGDCLDCMVSVKTDDSEKSVIACRTNIEPGMNIIRISKKIRFI